MTLRASLVSRVARLEKADAAACPVCNGNAIRMEWTGEAGATGPEPRAAADVPQACGGCGRPMQVIRLSWLDAEAADKASR